MLLDDKTISQLAEHDRRLQDLATRVAVVETEVKGIHKEMGTIAEDTRYNRTRSDEIAEHLSNLQGSVLGSSRTTQLIIGAVGTLLALISFAAS